MVTDFILDWWFDLVEWLVNLFPTSELPADAIDLSWISDMNYFVPISEMFMVFIAFVALGGPLVGSSLIIWVLIGIIRGGQTKA